MELEKAEARAKAVVEKLRPCCSEIEIAGSRGARILSNITLISWLASVTICLITLNGIFWNLFTGNDIGLWIRIGVYSSLYAIPSTIHYWSLRNG